MNAAEILVIFLSVALAIFLVLAIVLIIYLIIIAKKIKMVAETAERAASNFEGLASIIRKAAAPAVVSKFVVDTITQIIKRRNDKEK